MYEKKRFNDNQREERNEMSCMDVCIWQKENFERIQKEQYGIGQKRKKRMELNERERAQVNRT